MQHKWSSTRSVPVDCASVDIMCVNCACPSIITHVFILNLSLTCATMCTLNLQSCTHCCCTTNMDPFTQRVTLSNICILRAEGSGSLSGYLFNQLFVWHSCTTSSLFKLCSRITVTLPGLLQTSATSNLKVQLILSLSAERQVCHSQPTHPQVYGSRTCSYFCHRLNPKNPLRSRQPRDDTLHFCGRAIFIRGDFEILSISKHQGFCYRVVQLDISFRETLLCAVIILCVWG